MDERENRERKEEYLSIRPSGDLNKSEGRVKENKLI